MAGFRWPLDRSCTRALCLILLITEHRSLVCAYKLLEAKGPSAHVDAAISPVQTLPRWVPKGDPLYHRRLSSPRFDMCAEALGMPKVALCFLTRGPVHQEAFWKQWLRQAEGLVLLPEAEGSQGAQTDAWTARDSAVAHKACRLERSIHSNVVRQQHMFTVYTHPTDTTFTGYRPGSVFYGSEVGNLLPGTSYASYDLVEAARSMLAAALQDRLNQRFVHLSESCIPLYPPALLYMQLVHEKKSRVHVENPVRQWNTWLAKEWKPVLETTHGLSRAHHWRKGSHWKAVIRKHAQLAVDDQQLVNAFSKDCKGCHVPERYFQTLLALHGLQNETFRNGWLTWVDWSRTDPSGAHPEDMATESVDEELLFVMRTSKMGDYQSRCAAAWDSAPLASAQQLLQSYLPGAKDWGLGKESGQRSGSAQKFAELEHECLLFGRKFKGHTISAVLDLLSHPQYSAWNYTAERLAPHVYE